MNPSRWTTVALQACRTKINRKTMMFHDKIIFTHPNDETSMTNKFNTHEHDYSAPLGAIGCNPGFQPGG